MSLTSLNLDPCKQFHADLDVRPVDTTPACKLLTFCLWTMKSQQSLLTFQSKAFQNDKLQKIRFENLARLTCLHIKDNEILESISASNLTDSYCIKISDNDKLKSIDFSDLINVIHMKIEDNQNLTTIKLPNFPGAGTSETVSLLPVPAMNSP